MIRINNPLYLLLATLKGKKAILCVGRLDLPFVCVGRLDLPFVCVGRLDLPFGCVGRLDCLLSV